MNLLFRNLFNNIVIYGSSELLIKAGAFLTIPIYTRIFSPKEYGILTFVLSAVGLLSVIISLGCETTYARFYFDVKTLKERQIVTSSWLFFLSFWTVTITLLCLPHTGLISTWSFETENYSNLFACALIAVPVNLINSLCGQVLRNQNRARLFSILNIISSFLTSGYVEFYC